MLKLGIFLLVLCIGLAATVTPLCDRHDDTCRELKLLRSRLKDSQKELGRYKSMLEQSTCTVCNLNGTNPCQNNGTCVILPSEGTTQKFACNCPYNYAGDLCQTKIECKNDTCGTDASCTVFNHKTVCTCPFGSSGDPAVACNYTTSQACLNGDPHYSTFDGLLFNYMGTCSYYVTKMCHNDTFYVVSNNYVYDANPHVSVEKSFTVHAYDQDFYVDSSGLQVNGINKKYDYFWPSYPKNDPLVSVKYANGRTTVNVKEYKAVISLVGNQLCVTLPHMQELYGDKGMCGAFGNMDGDCTDDVVFANGTSILTNSKCAADSLPQPIYSAFVDSWILPNRDPGCIDGSTMTLNAKCNLTRYAAACAPISQVLASPPTGPFAACSVLGTETVKEYNYNCLYDACAGANKCDSLAAFARLCQNRVPFVKIDSWRNGTDCPYHCEPHSHYSLSSPSCQPTCSRTDQVADNGCLDIPEEGCICDVGYFLDPNVDPESEAKYACRLLEDCGCTDVYGNYYLPGSTFMNANCTQVYTCEKGQLSVSPVNCSAHGQCVIEGGEGHCKCESGYLQFEETCVAPPMRHCADLYVKQNARTSAIYEVYLGATFDNETLFYPGIYKAVWCDMATDKGGWTLVAGGKDMSYAKSWNEYRSGWNGLLGQQKTNIGLDALYRMTNETDTSLRVFIDRCPENPTPVLKECTYPLFKVYSEVENFAVYIPEPCGGGNETNPWTDPWIQWDPSQLGPGFVTYDNDNSVKCSAEFQNTGWWFTDDNCGSANLFGQRQGCGAEYNGSYTGIFWNNKAIDDAFLYARPRSFPEVD